MRASELNRTIIVERPTETLDDFGTPVLEWIPVGAFPVKKLSAPIDRTVSERGTDLEETATFEARFTLALRIGDRVKVSGSSLVPGDPAWKIVGLEETKTRREMRIECQRFGA